MRDAEYDRFGPWILEITPRDPIPRLFASHHTRVDTPLLAIKIPRPIDRQIASPGMHLYDVVMHLYEEEMEILRRVKGSNSHDSVLSETVRYEKIISIVLRENLLNGSLTLHMRQSECSFGFSTVSMDIITRMITLIQQRYTPQSSLFDPPSLAPAPSLSAPSLQELDCYYMNLVREEGKQHPAWRIIGHQHRTPLGSVGEGSGKSLFNRIVAKDLLETLHFSDGRELSIITRGRDFRYLHRSVYGKEQWYIPIRNVRQIRIDTGTGGTELAKISVSTDVSCCSFWVQAGNPLVGSFESMSELVMH